MNTEEMGITKQDLDRQYLLSAFLALEPSDYLISFARKCGSGSISEDVQQFIWDHCFNNTLDENCNGNYLKLFLKKLIKEVETESTGGNVLDEFYERYAQYMVSLKEDAARNDKSWIVKYISYYFHDVPSHLGPMQVVVPLQCSLNMLQGDTGCALWPSSLFLSEFILSFPEVFTGRSCFEVGSGVGLVGVCLNHVKASQVILTDGDASSLENLKQNLVMNKIEYLDAYVESSASSSYLVQSIHLPWESAGESKLQKFEPDIVLGADVIYNPSCLPHLVRVLSILLNRRKTIESKLNDNARVIDRKVDCSNDNSPAFDEVKSQAVAFKSLFKVMERCPVALIASVIRNIDTFNCFQNLCEQNDSHVWDATETISPFNLLPYMESYKRSDVRLLILFSLRK